MFGRLQTECGYTPDEIRAMTLFDVERLSRFWQQQPPVRDLLHAIAVWAGAVKPPAARKSKKQASAGTSLGALKSLIGEM